MEEEEGHGGGRGMRSSDNKPKGFSLNIDDIQRLAGLRVFSFNKTSKKIRSLRVSLRKTSFDATGG